MAGDQPVCFKPRTIPVGLVLALSLGIPAFVGYLVTLAPTITWLNWGIDTGEWGLAPYRLTLPHPSGAPLFLIIGHLFTLLPLGSVVHRISVLSALFGAAAAGVAGWFIYAEPARFKVQPPARYLAALLGAGLFAFSPTFWSQAVIAETYTFHAFLVVTLVRLLLAFRDASPARRRWLVMALALTCGLGLGNHMTFTLVLPATALFVVADYIARHRTGQTVDWGTLGGAWRLLRGDIVWAGPVFLLALTPYALLLLWFQQGAYPTLWEAGTPAALLDHVSGGAFRSMVGSVPLSTTFSRLSSIPRLLFEQFGLAGVACVTAGFWALLTFDKRLLAFVGVAAGCIIAFAINYPVFNSEIYLIPVFLLAALLAGWGAAWLLATVLEISAGRRGARWVGVALLATALGIPGGQFLANRATVDASNDWTAYDEMTQLLDDAPARALMISGAPEEVLALWYLQYAEDHRPDVIVIDAFWSFLPTYQRNLQRQFPEVVPAPGTNGYLRALVTQNEGNRPVLATSKAQPFLPDLTLTQYKDELMYVGASPQHVSRAP